MSDVSSVSKPRSSFRRLRSIHHVHYDIQRNDDEVMAKPLAMPMDALEVQAYTMQVAGHSNSDDKKFLGLLQCSNGTVLKPIIKESQKREIDFYNRISLSKDPDLVELRSCVPKYFGCKKFTYNGYEQEYLILEDLTERMLEPCIMDVKIGRRTWDPLASEEKIKNEQSKYAACKQQYGFCIPGFQVYKHTTGQLHKYNKDYGKKLHGDAVKDALRKYVSGGGAGGALCRALLLQMLSELWRVQRWARGQSSLRLYSASLLLVYDAARLRRCCGDEPHSTRGPPARRHSVGSGVIGGGSNFSGQLSANGPRYSRVSPVPMLPLSLSRSTFSPPSTRQEPASSWGAALQRISTTHSPDHNYDDKLSKIRMNYRATLDRLSYDAPTPNPWGTVKIIDFAHAFFNDDDERAPDENFRDGIDNFVEIFETFLRETDDQIIYA